MIARIACELLHKILGNPAVQAKLDQLVEQARLSDERLSRAIQGKDIDRIAQIERLPWHWRLLIQSLILALAAGRTNDALFSLRSLEMNLETARRKAAQIRRVPTMAELRAKA